MLNAILLYGVSEVILKVGAEGCHFASNGELGFVPVREVSVVDTTSAGDSFNAGYLNKRLQVESIESSCKAGHNLASTVIQHHGAIIPREAMPAELDQS